MRDAWDRMGDIDRVAPQFIPTRGRPWPQVTDFLGLVGGGVVGDLGCGNGRHALAAARMGLEVVAIDISATMIRHLRRRGRGMPRLHPIVASVTHLPIRSGALSAALLIAVIHNIPTLRLRLKALHEAWRALRQGGWAMVTVWSALQPRHIAPLALGLAKLFLGRLWEPFDAEVPWRAGVRGAVYRFYHLYTAWELRCSLAKAAPWICRVFRMDIRPSVFPQNYAAICLKK